MSEYERFLDIVARLRGEGGCPWDREQTHSSLKPGCIEEASEVICGIDILEETGNADNLVEELGDLMLQIVLQAQIGKEEGLFDMDDILKGISDKMIRRHPHVFGDETADTSEEVLVNWAKIKEGEKKGKEWMDERLLLAFDESKDLIEVARKRKMDKIAKAKEQ